MSEPIWYDHIAFRSLLLVSYIAVLALIGLYGLHRYWIVLLYWRHHRKQPHPKSRFNELPPVTVQLPMYNESNVAQRVIDAACSLDYPRDKLQVQVLDDSTDECGRIASQRCETWRSKGIDIQYRHRTNRLGFKAGALQDALVDAKGRFIAVFDADFVPPSDFIHKTIHHFTDETVGMVQTRWAHLNRTNSLLTRLQAIFLDGHFVIEHTARNRSRCWINFNGTAGIWRRAAIETAGGWQHDTLTEDVDLSYRSQLAGWNFVYLPAVTCPAELPPEINAFKAQQHRWTKGSIQTAIKILPRVFAADVPLRVKSEAFFHLTCPMVYVFLTLLALLFLPTLYVSLRPFESGTTWGTLLMTFSFVLGSASVGVFYVSSQKAQDRPLWSAIIQIPMVMGLGVGISINNARACIEGLVGHESPFVRTPKYNSRSDQPLKLKRPIPTGSARLWLPLLEIAMGLYMVNCAHAAVHIDGAPISVPFLLLFACGYFYVGLSSIWIVWQSHRAPQHIVGVHLRANP